MTVATSSSPRILALDTAQEDCSAAALSGAEVLAEKTRHVGNKHAEHLLAMTDEVLNAAGWRKCDAEIVAFGAGPGAFTGLRVACGAAQGLAWAWELPVAAVCNLEALALGAKRAVDAPLGTRIAAINDARMNECYAAVYEVTQGPRLRVVAESALVKPDAVAAYLLEFGALVLAGSAKAVYDMALPDGVRYVDGVKADAALIGEIAAAMAAGGELTTAAAAAPLYVRNRVALTIEERARGERL